MSKLGYPKKMEHTIFYMHIPKTAGRTLEAILQREYSSKEIYDIYGYGLSIQEAVKKLLNLSEEDKKQIKLIKGHYQFGLHQFLPQQSTYITLLRKPIDRVISLYFYILRDSSHSLNNIIKKKNMSLKDFVTSGISLEVDNGQTRIISGREKQYDFGTCNTDLLVLVKDNIEKHFSFVGLVERFEESLILMSQIFGWHRIYYLKRNVTKGRSYKREIGTETLKAIERYNELDLELYEYAEKKFEELICRHGYRLHQRLLKLKIQNLGYWGYTKFTALFLK